MQSRILVPLDGSAYSEEILPHAKGIARAAGAALTLLRVVGEESKIPAAREYVEALARDLDAEGKVSLSKTDVTSAILEEASRDPPALVAMSSHGRTGILEALVGSVALGVVRKSGQPILLCRPRGNSKGKLGTVPKVERVVLPLNGSAFSESMIPAAVEMADSLKVHLVLVHVVSPDVKVPPGIPAGDVLETSYIRSTAQMIERTHGVQPDWDVLHGDPGDAICRYLRGQRDAMLAMASRSRRGLGQIVFGSVAGECLRRSGAPILMLWPNRYEEVDIRRAEATRSALAAPPRRLSRSSSR